MSPISPPAASRHLPPTTPTVSVSFRPCLPYFIPSTPDHRDRQPLQYEFYFPALADFSEEGYAITITAQLGPGAKASHWKIDIFKFGGGESWVGVGDMSGGEQQHRQREGTRNRHAHSKQLLIAVESPARAHCIHTC